MPLPPFLVYYAGNHNLRGGVKCGRSVVQSYQMKKLCLMQKTDEHICENFVIRMYQKLK